MSYFYQTYFFNSNRVIRSVSTALFTLLFLMLTQGLQAQEPVEVNTLPDGDYYIKIRGTDEYVSRDPDVALSAPDRTYEAFFMYSRPAAADRSLQRFNIVKRSNGRYTFRLHNPGKNEGYLVEWWEIFWVETGYSLDHHTFNIYKKGNGAYAIQTDGLVGKKFIAFNQDARKRLINEGLNVNDPVSFPFELIPYNGTLSEANLTLPSFPSKQAGAPNFSPGATSNSSAAITYSSDNPNVAVIENGEIKITGPGTATITAYQAANATHNADQASRVLKVEFPASFLVSSYQFNGTLTDAGATNAASSQGDITFVNGLEQNAVKLDGTDFLSLPTGIANHDNITIATAVKLSANPSWSRIFDFGTDRGNYMFLTTSMGNEGKIRFAIKANRGVEEIITSTASNVVPADTWTHIALTLSSDGLATIYVNGIAIPTEQSVTPFTMKASDLGVTTQNMIGYSHFPDNYLDAAIENFRIYNYVLTPTEVQALSASTLPVELIEYTAKANNKGSVHLRWTTASETNNDHYILERSSDGKTFSKLTKVTAKGQAGTYSFTDYNPISGDNYYRLIQFDKDGSQNELGIQVVSVSLSEKQGLLVTPNPVVGSVITFQAPGIKQATFPVEIFDINGKRVLSTTVARNQEGTYSVNINLSPGMYLLTADNLTAKFFKNN